MDITDIKKGEVYRLKKAVATFDKGAQVKMCVDRDTGEMILGANTPGLVFMALASQGGMALFIDPKDLELAA